MKRHSFIREEALRPRHPFAAHIIVDAHIAYFVNGILSGCHLTLYHKKEFILSIAHEDNYVKSGLTIGESVREILRYTREYTVGKKHIFVQGHNGIYEYVKEKCLNVPGLERRWLPLLVIMNPAHESYEWSPAGSLDEVLERHLK